MTRILCLILLLTILACSASRGHIMLEETLTRGLDRMTYEDAVNRYGKTPYRSEDNQYMTAVWIENYGRDFYMMETPEGAVPIGPYVFLRTITLRFHKETGVLKAYRIEYE